MTLLKAANFAARSLGVRLPKCSPPKSASFAAAFEFALLMYPQLNIGGTLLPAVVPAHGHDLRHVVPPVPCVAGRHGVELQRSGFRMV
jgi:hypothetical protein